MMLLIVIFLLCSNYFSVLFGSDSVNHHVDLFITSSTGAPPSTLYKVESTLNLTCTIINHNVDIVNISDYILEWIPPGKTINSANRLVYKKGQNYLNLIIQGLRETDSGDYRCLAQLADNETSKVEATVRITVRKRKECSDNMFSCGPHNCIGKRFLCDGKTDCPNGDDESEPHCGSGPCSGKLRCPDGRCIPVSWCCDPNLDVNCTTKVRLPCCQQLDKYPWDGMMEDGSMRHYDIPKINEIGFLQTTVFTVIGCAMAFMFIVTILVIALCRVHMKRTLLSSRCPGPIRPDTSAHINTIPFCDLYSSTQYHPNNDLISNNPLLVAYNINSGIQFVGKPIDPPPYCEIVAAPPREGPPPPYVSHENIQQSLDTECQVTIEAENNVDTEQHEDNVTEGDALLGNETNITPSDKDITIETINKLNFKISNNSLQSTSDESCSHNSQNSISAVKLNDNEIYPNISTG